MDPINEIQTVGLTNIWSVRIMDIPVTPLRTWSVIQPSTDYLMQPVVINIGSPIVEMTACVKMHRDNKIHKTNIPIDKDLVNTDPKKSTVLCPDGVYPSYDSMNYEPEHLIITREQAPPPISGPPDAPPTPETPEAPKDITKGDPECPGPQSLRIGALGPSEKEKVIGHELKKNTQGKLICVELYEDINLAEQYLPSAQVASTTAVIATVAASSALLAKPLADLLLKVVKPVVKKVIGKVNAILGKTPYRPTQEELKTNEYRVKKGLLPIPFAKNHQKKMKAQKEEEKKQKKNQK